MALLPKADDIIGSGITRATWERIDGTSDTTRGGMPRIDFVFYRADGTYCRLHPGTKKQNDAAPVFSRRQSAQSTAAEQTTPPSFWAALPENPYTYATACTIPTHDRIGKESAYQSLPNAPLGPLSTTTEATFKWWLFVANLGGKTQAVFGDGLIAAELEEKTDIGVTLVLRRLDDTLARVEIWIGAYETCRSRRVA